MSVEQSLDVDVDHREDEKAARATLTPELDIDELFVDSELWLWEGEDWWRGYYVEDGQYYFWDTRYDDSWFGEQPVLFHRARDRGSNRSGDRSTERGDNPLTEGGTTSCTPFDGFDDSALDDQVPEQALDREDIVHIGYVEPTLGVVVTEAPEAKVQAPDWQRAILARSGPVVRVLEDWDRLVGRDGTGSYHLYSEHRQELIVREIGSEPEVRYEFPPERLPAWVRYVERERGWGGLEDDLRRILEVTDV